MLRTSGWKSILLWIILAKKKKSLSKSDQALNPNINLQKIQEIRDILKKYHGV